MRIAMIAPAAAMLLSFPFSLPAQIASLGYPLPVANANPHGITVGPDGALWFTEGAGIGRISTAGAISEHAVAADRGPYGIVAGPDGGLWFTQRLGNEIARMATDGSVSEYPIPTPASGAGNITKGPDGALWFTEEAANKIGRITTAGAITEYAVPTGGSRPLDIVTGPDGALWFTERAAIGRISATGAITEYRLPAGSQPFGITSGPDGALWFTEDRGIGRMDTAGAIKEYAVATANAAPHGITAGPDGSLWFTEFNGNRVARISTRGVITEYLLRGANSYPEGITAGSDGELWWTEAHGNRIGQGVFVTANLTVDPETGCFGTSISFTGGGFAPNEVIQIFTSGVGSPVLATATADAAGGFTVSSREVSGRADRPHARDRAMLHPRPPRRLHQAVAPNGPRLYLGRGMSSGKLGAAPYSVTAKLVVNPSSVAAGDSITVQGFGFGSLETVTISLDNPGLTLGTATANVEGTLTGFTVRVPEGAATGSNGIRAVGESTGASSSAVFSMQ